VEGKWKVRSKRKIEVEDREEVMAGRRVESAGSSGSAKGVGVGKVGKGKAEDRQSRLAMVEKDGGKRVTFKLDEKEEVVERHEAGLADMIRHEVKREINEELKEREEKMRKEIEEMRLGIKKKEEKWEGFREMVRGWETIWEGKWKEMREDLSRLEKELYTKLERKIEEMVKYRLGEEVEVTSQDSVREGHSCGSERGESVSKGSRYGGSTGTIWSEDRLSNREVEKIRKWVSEKERMVRRENIVLRGIALPRGGNGKGER